MANGQLRPAMILVATALGVAGGFAWGRNVAPQHFTASDVVDPVVARIDRVEKLLLSGRGSDRSSAPVTAAPAVEVNRAEDAQTKLVALLEEVQAQLRAIRGGGAAIAVASPSAAADQLAGLTAEVDAKDFDRKAFANSFFCWTKWQVYARFGMPDFRAPSPDGSRWEYRISPGANGLRWVSFHFSDGIVVDVQVEPR
jgi:hypothetical protein